MSVFAAEVEPSRIPVARWKGCEVRLGRQCRDGNKGGKENWAVGGETVLPDSSHVVSLVGLPSQKKGMFMLWALNDFVQNRNVIHKARSYPERSDFLLEFPLTCFSGCMGVSKAHEGQTQTFNYFVPSVKFFSSRIKCHANMRVIKNYFMENITCTKRNQTHSSLYYVWLTV